MSLEPPEHFHNLNKWFINSVPDLAVFLRYDYEDYDLFVIIWFIWFMFSRFKTAKNFF